MGQRGFGVSDCVAMSFCRDGQEVVFGAEFGEEERVCVVIDDGGCIDGLDEVFHLEIRGRHDDLR